MNVILTVTYAIGKDTESKRSGIKRPNWNGGVWPADYGGALPLYSRMLASPAGARGEYLEVKVE